MLFIIDILGFMLEVYTYLLVTRALSSWIWPNSEHPLLLILFKVTDPVLKPIQSFLPVMGNMDLSPVVAIIVVQAIKNVVLSYMGAIFSGTAF